MGIDKELELSLFHQREEQRRHMEYQKEFGFYRMIVSGNLKEIKRLYSSELLEMASKNMENGVLSKDPVRNERYHFVVLTALITRLCVENGLDREKAYTLSDLYINKMDVCMDIAGIIDIQREMVIEYTKQMAHLRKEDVYSIQVMKAIDYVYAHLNEKISVEQIADALRLNRSYLSELFHRETGKTISSFIRVAKLTAASNMLKYSDYEYSDIAEYFAFASQSHFTKCFKEETGYTPKQYRTRFYQPGEWNLTE